jgi:tetratricopeptide (TPR) repeat protein
LARQRSKTAAPPVHAARSAKASTRGVVLGVLAALVLLTVATYAPVWRFGFVALDDPQYVYENHDLAGGLTAKSVAWAFTTGRESNWHPLTWLSHAMDISVFGLNSGWHHVSNLLLHLLNTLLLFGVLRRMTGSIWRSAFVAAIFAVHPLHVESVAWVAERKDVLSALFFMLTLGAYVRYVEAPSRLRYAVVAAALALGLMAKAMLVTMPMLLLLLDYWPLGRVAGAPAGLARERRSWRGLIVEKMPLLIIVAASSVVTFLVQSAGGSVKSLESFPLGLRLQNVIVSYADYVRLSVWPANLGVFYPFPSTLPATPIAMSATLLIGLTIAACWRVRRAPFVTVGWLWFIGMLVPVIGFVQIGGHARADRYMYLPLIGLTIAVAWGAVALAKSEAVRRAVALAGVGVVLASAVVAHAQVQYWRDTVALWSHTAEATEGLQNFGVYFGLAEYLRGTGRAAESIPVYEASIARNANYLDARLGLVGALVETHQSARAIDALRDIVRLNPAHVQSRMSLGSLLAESQRSTEAIPQFTEVVRLQPGLAEGHWRLGLAFAETGHLIDALPEFAEAVRLSPESALMRNDYGWALAQHSQIEAATAQLTEALRLRPDFVDAHHNLGRLLAAQKQWEPALAHLSEAVRLEPGFLDARLSLGLTLLRAGRTDAAVQTLLDVLRQDPQNQAARRALAAIGK